MRFLRVGEPGAERPACLAGERIVDLSSRVADLTPDVMGSLGELGADIDGLPTLEPGRIGPPVSRPGKIVCVGVNYLAHADETQTAVPDEPPLFMKAPDTVVGPDDPVLIPPGSTATDYEVELAVVMGRVARYLGDDVDPLDYVAGYAVSNDVSERTFQLERGGQWDKGKNCETFNPLGPWLVTPDEADPSDLAIECRVNGEVRQSSSTKMLIVSVPDLIRYISGFMVLYPGDVINTGTPNGVAIGYPDPKPYLVPGDVMELTIGGLGTQRQELVAASP
ncbi:MAG: fumarylacetoacetate hydrolase family protein [Actinomycetota bacterium]